MIQKNPKNYFINPVKQSPADPSPSPHFPLPPVGVQQQWAAYYQQLVQMYGESQAQLYWTQLSQQQQAAQQPQ